MKYIPNGYQKFRFWCQKVLPLVYDDSLSYYEVISKLVKFVNDLAERISDAFEEINLNVKQYVENWLDEHPEATTTVEDGAITSAKLNEEIYLTDEDVYNIKNGGTYSGVKVLNGYELKYYNDLSKLEWGFTKGKVTCNVIGELPLGVQGACWVDAHNYVFAIPDTPTTCNVYKWDESTHTLSDPVNLQVYHANSIAYNPTNGYLYFADAITNDGQGDLLNTITVVRYSDLSFVKRITSPAEGGIYSVAYDRDTNTFYSTNYRGNTEGQANALYEWNGEFESVNRKIILDDLTVRFNPTSSSQGVQCVVNGVAYIPYYEISRVVVGYNLTDGKKVSVSNIPRCLNGYRHARELEAVTYNYDTKQYIVFNSNTAFEVGIKHAIVEKRINALYVTSTLRTLGIYINYDISSNNTSPATDVLSTIPEFRSFTDARTFAAENNLSCTFILLHSGTDMHVTENIWIESIDCVVTTQHNNIILDGECACYSSNVAFRNVKFNGTINQGGDNCNIACINSNATFSECVFTDTNNNNKYDVVGFRGSKIIFFNNTYNHPSELYRGCVAFCIDNPTVESYGSMVFHSGN